MSISTSLLIVVLFVSLASFGVWAIDYLIVQYTKSSYIKKINKLKENSQNEENT